MSEPAPDERDLWLYVVTRRDLAPEIQTVQLGHACSECIQPEHAPLRKDARLVWLQAKDEAELRVYLDEIERKSIPHAAVYETDGEIAGQLTAIAVSPTRQRSKIRKIFHHLAMATFAPRAVDGEEVAA